MLHLFDCSLKPRVSKVMMDYEVYRIYRFSPLVFLSLFVIFSIDRVKTVRLFSQLQLCDVRKFISTIGYLLEDRAVRFFYSSRSGLLIGRSSRWVWIWGEGTRVMRALVHLHIQTLATTLARLWDESRSRANDDPRWPLYDALLLLHHRSNTPIDRVNGFECFSSLPSPFHLEKLTLETLRFLSSSSGSTLFRNFTKENVSIGERRFVYTLLFLSFFCFLTARRMVNSPSNFPSQ